jgi:hypothetical protein
LIGRERRFVSVLNSQMQQTRPYKFALLRPYLHSLAGVQEEVGAVGVGAEAPNLLGQLLVPAEVVAHNLGADLSGRKGGGERAG